MRYENELYFEDFLAHSKSLAMFVTPKAEQIIEIPVPITENQITFGRPAGSQLLWLLDEYK